MPDPSGELAQLRRQIEHLEARIRALEQGRESSPSRPSHESRFGLTAVNRIGAFTLAIGIAFFFKYAVDNLWLGATGRVTVGISAGLVLLIAAEFLQRREQRTFAQGIAGCGIATLYISVYAASVWYTLIPPAAAFVAVAAICAAAIALSFRYSNSAIAVIGLLGGLLTPLLLHTGTPAPLPDAVYLFALDSACVVIAIRQRWAFLVPIVGAAALFTAWLLFDPHHPRGFTYFAFAAALLHAAASARASAALRPTLYYVASGCFTAGALRTLALWAAANVAAADRGSVISEMGSVFLGLYGIAALLYSIARSSQMNRVLALFLLGLVIAKLYLWDVWFLRHVYRTTAFVSLGVLLLAASWIYSRSRPAANR